MDNIGNVHCEVHLPSNELKTKREIEKSIIKKYRKELWTPFVKGLKEFDMIQKGDKVAVAISGGKDSFLLAKALEELKRHGQMDFDVVYISMDPGYNDGNLELLKKNADHLGIELNILNTDVFQVAQKIASDYPCYLCARMRRGHLYNYAKELGCNKLALGHHFDDVIETVMLNILYAGNFKTMMPKLPSTNFEGMELIRPLYFVKEKDILNWADFNGLTFMNCGCVVAAGKTSSKRKEVKELIKSLKKVYKDVDKSIFRATTNANLDALIGWVKDGEKHSFLEEYGEDNNE